MRFLCISWFLCVLNNCIGTDSGAIQDVEQSPIVLTAELGQTDDRYPGLSRSSYPLAIIESDALRAGRVHHLVLKLKNVTRNDITFKKITVGCACTDVKIDSNVFKVESETIVRVRFTAPKSNEQSSINVRISFYGDDDANRATPVADVRLVVPVAGNLSIDTGSTNLELTDDGLSVFEFPVRFTLPVKFENLIATKSLEFRDLSLQLDSADGRVRMVLKAAAAMIPPEGLTGRIDIKDTVNDISTGIQLTVSPRKKISVTPQVLLFRYDEELPGKSKAMALLRVNPSSEHPDSRSIESLSCHLGEERLKVEVVEIGSGIYRADIVVADTLLDSVEESGGNRQIIWQVQITGEVGVSVVKTFFHGALK